MKTIEESIDMLEHVFYEIDGYLNGYISLVEGNLIPEDIRNLIIAATGLHARNMIESFTDRKCNKDTVKINGQYCFNEQLKFCENNCKAGSKFRCFTELYSHLCKICNHLSRSRQFNTEPSWNDCFNFFNEYMLPHINNFVFFLEDKEEYCSEKNLKKYQEIKEKIIKIQNKKGLFYVTDTATTYASATAIIQG